MTGVADLALEPGVVLVLLAVAAAAGWIDAVSGGGGLLQLPALLLMLPGVPAVVALGTNKVSSAIGTAAAAATYAHRLRPRLASFAPMAVAAFVGSLIGATFASRMPGEALLPVVWGLLLVVWLWTLLRPALGIVARPRWSGRRHVIASVVAGVSIGAYDGLIGPGTGSFLLMALVAGLGMTFLQASATAKVVNLGTNLAALIVFALNGHVLWWLGLGMGMANMVGGVLGARTAIGRGSRFVRGVFLVVVGALILRLGWTLFLA